MKSSKKLILSFAADLLAACLLLLVFAFIHHGGSYLKYRLDSENSQSRSEQTEEPDRTASSPENIAQETAAPETEETASELSGEEAGKEQSGESEGQEAESSEEESSEPDNRTEWQIRFADHFTDEVIQTENSYTSPNVSITITTHQEELDGLQVVYYVADVYIASIECFRTYIANNNASSYSGQDVLEMDEKSGAILGMTGDFYSYQYAMLMIRNGVTLRKNQTTSDICVLYKDGTIKTYGPSEYDFEEILADENIWQLWHFGPKLLDDDGNVMETFNASTSITYPNPRSSMGYYEPGHYCFIVCDGRQSGWSDGTSAETMAKIYKELGCVQAYNLDGGGSAVMTFNDSIISQQSNGNRQLSDIVLIGEPDTWDPETFNTGE